MNIPWDEEVAKRLAELAAQGLSASQIGRALGVTRNAVIGKARRAGIALLYQRPDPEPRAPREPRPPRAPRVRLSRSSVEAARNRLDRGQRRDIVRLMYLAGDTYTAICNETGYTNATIVTITRDLPRRRFANVRKRYPLQFKVDAVVALLTGERLCHLSRRIGAPRRALDLWRMTPAIRDAAQPIADRINAEREAEARTAATLKAQAEARERMWIDANNAEVFALMPERDVAMMRRRAAGETLEAVAGDYGITRERVRQIEARWRCRGLIVAGAKPLSEATTHTYGQRPPKPPKAPNPERSRDGARPLDFWASAARDLADERAATPKRPYRISEETREARNLAISQKMRAHWAAKREAAA